LVNDLWIDCGAPRAWNASCKLLESRNVILGAIPDPVDMGPTLDVELETYDRIILYTDGLTEVFDSRGGMLGIEGLQKFVRETSVLPLGEMKQGILNRVAAWRDAPPTDDISLVLLEIP
jgi:two-component system, sensor histidine kinase ChiS